MYLQICSIFMFLFWIDMTTVWFWESLGFWLLRVIAATGQQSCLPILALYLAKIKVLHWIFQNKEYNSAMELVGAWASHSSMDLCLAFKQIWAAWAASELPSFESDTPCLFSFPILLTMLEQNMSINDLKLFPDCCKGNGFWRRVYCLVYWSLSNC